MDERVDRGRDRRGSKNLLELKIIIMMVAGATVCGYIPNKEIMLHIGALLEDSRAELRKF